MKSKYWRKCSEIDWWNIWQSKENPELYLSFYSCEELPKNEKAFYSKKNNITLIYIIEIAEEQSDYEIGLRMESMAFSREKNWQIGEVSGEDLKRFLLQPLEETMIEFNLEKL